jgi:hypothetical protein
MPPGTERTRRYGNASVARAPQAIELASYPARHRSAPETGFLGGATALRVTSGSDADTRPSTDQLYAAYTAKQQFRAFVSTDRWTAGNRWGVNAQLEYQRFPQPFFGVGIGAPESAEEWYEARTVLANVTVRRRIARALYGQSGYRYSDTKIRDAEEGGVIARGVIPGAAGGVVSQLLAGGAWDSRDNVFAPASGTFVQATGAYSGSVFGADYEFSRYIADARRYVRLGRGVLAGQAYVEATSRGAPFDQLSLVGSGTIMRGYVRGRYRDRELAAAQVEYRLPVVGRFGVAAFRRGGDGRADAVHAPIEHAAPDVRRRRAMAAPAEAAHDGPRRLRRGEGVVGTL